jgi:anthranilate synthase/aminodeoxychorismate synthase-like glutamine amidotransferase
MRTLIIDNHDSFTFNLYQLVGELGALPTVVRNDAIDLEGVRRFAPDRIILSPGPGHPGDLTRLGVGEAVILDPERKAPVLGVCLGHQAIVQLLGGSIVRAPSPMHGKTSPIHHDGAGLFLGLPNPMIGMRYHSLVVDPDRLPACFERSAWTDDGVVMGVRHREAGLEGIQFHPESIGTPDGLQVLKRFVLGAPRA